MCDYTPLPSCPWSPTCSSVVSRFMAAAGVSCAASLVVLSPGASQNLGRKRQRDTNVEWHEHVRHLAEVAEACRRSAHNATPQEEASSTASLVQETLTAALQSAKDDINWSSR